MKKTIIILSAIMAAMSTACTFAPVVEEEGGDPIVFSVSKETRGSVVAGNTLPDGSKFSVYAAEIPSLDGGATPGDPEQSSKSYINNITVTKKNATTLTYGNQYWPEARNSTLKFYGLYPVPSTSVGVSASNRLHYAPPYLEVEVTVNNDITKHQDILYTATGILNREEVHLSFRHAMTRISFVARLDPEMEEIMDEYPNMEIFVERITLSNVIQKGVFFIYGPDNTVWTPSTASTDSKSIVLETGGGGLEEKLLVCGTAGQDDNYENLLTDGVDLMLIPQPLYPMELVIDLNIITGEASEGGDTPQTEKNRFILPIDQNALWTPGRHITYKLNVAKDVVVAGALIGEWTPASGETIEFD